ncbi:MAG: DUF3341 domain-containing protein [Leptospiraceae bacterium]|nr:DUF3341 domain-containing protein [Leptospiraceae bacterium]MDW8306736.1 DUF3341 domain-containing protein [Leptospiraceae bacterium]
MVSFKEVKEGLFSYEEPDKGWVAIFTKPQELLKAAEKVRDAGIKRFDCFTPMPIHGLDKAMGLKRSWVPFVTLVTGLGMALLEFLYILYIDVINWPIVYGGKPHFSFPAYIPILFEVTVFMGGVCTAAAVIVLGRLGKINRKPIHPRVTSDTFALWIGDELSRQEVEKILSPISCEIKPLE